MKEALTITQIVISISLITAILLQSRGRGLSATWGGAGESYQSRRGVEHILFIATIFLSLLFFIVQLVILVA